MKLKPARRGLYDRLLSWVGFWCAAVESRAPDETVRVSSRPLLFLSCSSCRHYTIFRGSNHSKSQPYREKERERAVNNNYLKVNMAGKPAYREVIKEGIQDYPAAARGKHLAPRCNEPKPSRPSLFNLFLSWGAAFPQLRVLIVFHIGCLSLLFAAGSAYTVWEQGLLSRNIQSFFVFFLKRPVAPSVWNPIWPV